MNEIKGGWPVVVIVAALIVGVFLALISGHNGLAIASSWAAALVTWRATR